MNSAFLLQTSRSRFPRFRTSIPDETSVAIIDECEHVEIERKVSTFERTQNNNLRDEIDEFILDYAK